MPKRKAKKSLFHKRIDRSGAVEYDYHLPVMLKQAVDLLITDANGIYIDGTLGGGGHSKEILEKLGSGGKLLAFDKDEAAIEHCSQVFDDELGKGEKSRIVLINESFENACSVREIHGRINGFLLDLGVSSRQLDDGTRGFTYRADSKLDMRFGGEGRDAESLIAAATEEELEHMLRFLGEEPNAKAIARRIIEVRRVVPLKSTLQLKQIVEDIVPQKFAIRTLSRVFQAIRIKVNDELETLASTLKKTIPALGPGGRIVIISYHSLEDRIVKSIMREFSPRYNKEHFDSNLSSGVPVLDILTKKPIIPDDDEILRNPRARSAKMRAAVRVG